MKASWFTSLVVALSVLLMSCAHTTASDTFFCAAIFENLTDKYIGENLSRKILAGSQLKDQVVLLMFWAA